MSFRARIEKTLTEASTEEITIVGISSMDDNEVNIHPAEYMSQLVVFTAPWIELDSEDPLVAHVSKQVLFIILAIIFPGRSLLLLQRS